MRLDDSFSCLTQWDTGRKIILEENETCDEVHFSNKSFGTTIDVKTYQLGDDLIANIPDELLQSSATLIVHCFLTRESGETTTISESFPVRPRNKPLGYIYNPDDQTRIKEFNEFVDDTIIEINEIKDNVEATVVHQPIIQNGTWWVWSFDNNDYIDTGVEAQGPQGEQGIQGEKGIQGDKGDPALINGVNTITIKGGTNINLKQTGTELIINNTNQTIDVVQTTGKSEISVMSQKAVTDEIELLNDDLGNYTDVNSHINWEIGTIVSTGYFYNTDKQIRFDCHKYRKGSNLKLINPDFRYRMYFYSDLVDSSMTYGQVISKFINYIEWADTDYEFSEDAFVIITVKKVDDSIADETFHNAIEIKENIALIKVESDIKDIQNAMGELNDSVKAKQEKLVILGTNRLDKLNPVFNVNWSYNEDNGTWVMTNSYYDQLRFDIELTKGEITFSFDIIVTSGSANASIRDTNNTTLIASYNCNGHTELKYSIPVDGTYRFIISGTSETSCGTVSNISVVYGDFEGYVPYSVYVDDAIIDFYDINKNYIKDYNRLALENYESNLKNTVADLKIGTMTDCHTDNIETYEMLYHLANSGSVNFCVNMGDYIPSHFESIKECTDLFDLVARNYNNHPTKTLVYLLRGNHDTNAVGNNDSSLYIKNRTFSDHMEYRTKNMYGLTDLNCGYVDCESAKIRVILLDGADIYDSEGNRVTTTGEVQIQQKQFEWFTNDALDFTEKKNPADWSVIIFCHVNLGTLCRDGFEAVLNAFMNGTSVNGSYSSNSAGYNHTLTANKDFSEQGALSVICTVSGHQHGDMIRTLNTTTPIKEVFVACENQSAYYKESQSSEPIWYERTPGTILEHCIDTVCVNKSDRTVTFKRLGIGSDRVISY